MMMSKSLPYDAEIEYLESVAKSTKINQYINTQIIPTINTKVEIKFSIGETNSNGFWGLRSDPYRFCCTTFSGGNLWAFAMTNNEWPTQRTSVRLNIQYVCVAENGKYSVDGTEYNTTLLSTFSANDYFYLFQNKNNFGVFDADARSKTKLFYCKIYENEVLVRDFIPVRVGQVGYMYDKVSGQLFGNQGTGDFVLGADKA